MQTADRFIALHLSAGEQHISLEPQLSPVRQAFLLVDVLLLLAAAGALALERRRRVMSERP